MAPSPGRPPDDRRRHEKLLVTAPSHKPTSGYDTTKCQVSKNLDRIASRDREPETETDNCQVGTVQLANKLAARNRRAKRIVTAKIAKTQEDHDLCNEKRISQQRACGNSDESPLCPVQANSNHIMKMLLAAEKSNPDLNHPRYNQGTTTLRWKVRRTMLHGQRKYL